MERELIRELANEVAALLFAMMQEGGCVRGTKGEPLDHEDSALGRACAYLGRPIPVSPEWDGPVQEIAPDPPS